MDTLKMLREMLAGAEEDLILYKRFKDCGNKYLEANYSHKEAQIERLKQLIEKTEQEIKAQSV